MFEAAIFGALAQSALIVGALLVWRFRNLTKPLTMGLIMAFGAGAVISAVGTDLVAVSYDEAGAGPTALGIGIGCLGYFFIVMLLEKRGKSDLPESPVVAATEKGLHHQPVGASKREARNLFVGMIIDGIPESVSIGLTVHLAAPGVSLALVGAIFVAGLPEAIGVAAALLAGGMTISRILARFGAIVVIGAVFGLIGYASLVGASPAVIATIQSIAAGALLVVVVNEMIPIAVRGAKHWAGPVAAAGFVFAAGMTWVTGG